jgi:hypothetical protein
LLRGRRACGGAAPRRPSAGLAPEVAALLATASPSALAGARTLQRAAEQLRVEQLVPAEQAQAARLLRRLTLGPLHTSEGGLGPLHTSSALAVSGSGRRAAGGGGPPGGVGGCGGPRAHARGVGSTVGRGGRHGPGAARVGTECGVESGDGVWRRWWLKPFLCIRGSPGTMARYRCSGNEYLRIRAHSTSVPLRGEQCAQCEEIQAKHFQLQSMESGTWHAMCQGDASRSQHPATRFVPESALAALAGGPNWRAGVLEATLAKPLTQAMLGRGRWTCEACYFAKHYTVGDEEASLHPCLAPLARLGPLPQRDPLVAGRSLLVFWDPSVRYEM